MLKICLQSIRFGLREYHRDRKMHIWKPKYYQAIPSYIKPNFFDFHDAYQLRTLQQVQAQLQGIQFSINTIVNLYPESDSECQRKQRKAIIQFEVQQFKFTEMQMSRFKLLITQNRLDKKTGLAKLTCDMFPTFQQNYDKITQMLYEIVMESKRAP